MIRFILLLLIVVVVMILLLRSNVQQRSWLKTGGILGLLILISRVTHIPLARLLQLLPYFVASFKRASQAQEQYRQTYQPGQGMTQEEACTILGVQAHATKEEIQRNYRRLMAQHHPDKGGSDYLAAKINEARDVLLAAKKND
ncbi:MAG: DnaJ domain-containing protein [Alphaproteobacteria bacterium]